MRPTDKQWKTAWRAFRVATTRLNHLARRCGRTSIKVHVKVKIV